VPGQPFVLANAWDIGSARMLVAMGAAAVGTSSAALAFTRGRADLGQLSREESLAHAAELAGAVDTPVSGDFENGYGHGASEVAATISAAIEKGVHGGSIEDIQAPSEAPYPFAQAVERIEAAAAAARAGNADFMLTARADGVMYGQYDLAEAIKRLQAFEAAGADVLYAPMPGDLEAVAKICRSVSAPVNALCAGGFVEHSRDDFANAGVARISLGSSLARVTHRAIHDCAKTMFNSHDFRPLGHTISGDTIEAMVVSKRPSRTD